MPTTTAQPVTTPSTAPLAASTAASVSTSRCAPPRSSPTARSMLSSREPWRMLTSRVLTTAIIDITSATIATASSSPSACCRARSALPRMSSTVTADSPYDAAEPITADALPGGLHVEVVEAARRCRRSSAPRRCGP